MNPNKPAQIDTKPQTERPLPGDRFQMPGIFGKLLRENSETHDKLGELSLLTALSNPKVSREQYLAALKKMYGLYVVLEPMLEQSTNWGLFGIKFDERRKLPLLEKDLRCFGVLSDELTEIPVCEDLPQLDTLSKALGCMAVVEGSTAGATATAQKLAVSELGLKVDNGGAFFNNYGDKRNEMRANFARVVAQQNVNEVEFLSAGKETFETFYTWLSK